MAFTTEELTHILYLLMDQRRAISKMAGTERTDDPMFHEVNALISKTQKELNKCLG